MQVLNTSESSAANTDLASPQMIFDAPNDRVVRFARPRSSSGNKLATLSLPPNLSFRITPTGRKATIPPTQVIFHV